MTIFSAGGRAASQSGSIRHLAPVAPSDTADLPEGVARGLFVGEAGDVVVVDLQGATATIASAGSQYHPVMVSRVLATGTTATRIVALY